MTSFDDKQSFGSLADFEASFSNDLLWIFRDAQRIYIKNKSLSSLVPPVQLTDASIPGSLWLGGQWAAKDATKLRERGITHILSVNGRRPFLGYGTTSIKIKVIDWDDEEREKLQPELDGAVKYVADVLAQGGSILVNCTAGRSRSATVVVAFLIATLGMTFDTALAHIKLIRPWATPNKGFERQLREWSKNHRRVNEILADVKEEDVTEDSVCELCQLEKTTAWYLEDIDFVIIECDQCGKK